MEERQQGRKLGRRGFLAGGLGAAVASLLGRTQAAQAEDGQPLILGKQNTSSGQTTLIRISRDEGPTVEISAPSGPVIVGRTGSPGQVTMTAALDAGVFGSSANGIGVIGHAGAFVPENPPLAPPSTAVFGVRGQPGRASAVTVTAVLGIADEGAGVQGVSPGIGVIGASPDGIGVVGLRGKMPELAGGITETAVVGIADRGTGVRGVSLQHEGVVGASHSGIGVLGRTGSEPSAVTYTAAVVGRAAQSPGVIGASDGGIGVIGLRGVTGGWPLNVTVTAGVAGLYRPSIGGSTGGSTGGAGVHGYADDPRVIGVLATNAAGGAALEVDGRASFSSIKQGSVPRRRDMAMVQDAAVTAESLVLVTLMGDPGNDASVHWIERQPGQGFVVHLTRDVRRATPFSYALLEPR